MPHTWLAVDPSSFLGVWLKLPPEQLHVLSPSNDSSWVLGGCTPVPSFPGGLGEAARLQSW